MIINVTKSEIYLEGIYISILGLVVSKIFRRKDITLTRNRVILICIQNTLVPPIAGYF